MSVGVASVFLPSNNSSATVFDPDLPIVIGQTTDQAGNLVSQFLPLTDINIIYIILMMILPLS